MKRARSAMRGFTLAEVLIALSITSLTVVVLASVLHSATSGARRGAEMSERFERDGTCERILRQLVADALWSGTVEAEYRFEGTPVSLSFSAYDRDRELVRLEVAADREMLFTLSIQEQFLNEDQLFKTSCFDEYRNLQMSYFGQERRGELAWRTNWRGDKPPRLVRIQGLGVEPGRMPLLLDMNVIAETPMICAYDPVSRVCLNGN